MECQNEIIIAEIRDNRIIPLVGNIDTPLKILFTVLKFIRGAYCPPTNKRD